MRGNEEIILRQGAPVTGGMEVNEVTRRNTLPAGVVVLVQVLSLFPLHPPTASATHRFLAPPSPSDLPLIFFVPTTPPIPHH